MGLEIDAYLRRIGCVAEKTATLETLQRLQACHARVIPYENIDCLLQTPIALDAESLVVKMVHHRRGGYCYENNSLFAAILTELGFSVSTLAARVQWRAAPTSGAHARTHMVLLVELPQGRYLVDVGFGSQTLTVPLNIDDPSEQQSATAVQRIGRVEQDYQLQVRIGSDFEPVYQFSLDPQEPKDWEIKNWYAATHPASKFRTHLIAAKAGDDGSYSLLNGALRFQDREGRSERFLLTSPTAVIDALERHFGVEVPAASFDQLYETLRRLLAR